ncbi:uncharacterized protein METZ01_LOCUS389123 [marine metagenome]|uniref:Uncharacterized protein n=1 Tax=marine metagenome TaxID=408172 RepID=A0A382UPU1_9ZZZZ
MAALSNPKLADDKYFHPQFVVEVWVILVIDLVLCQTAQNAQQTDRPGKWVGQVGLLPRLICRITSQELPNRKTAFVYGISNCVSRLRSES